MAAVSVSVLRCKPLYLLATAALVLVFILFLLRRQQGGSLDTSNGSLKRMETQEGSVLTHDQLSPVSNHIPPPINEGEGAGVLNRQKKVLIGQPFYSIRSKSHAHGLSQHQGTGEGVVPLGEGKGGTQESPDSKPENKPQGNYGKPEDKFQERPPGWPQNEPQGNYGKPEDKFQDTPPGWPQNGPQSNSLKDVVQGSIPDRQVSQSAPTAPAEQSLSTQPSLPTFTPSKDLFVRAVYFDSRPRDKHRNTSVFLVVCHKKITDNHLIRGCQVDGVRAEHFSVNLIGETPLWRAFYPHINHEEVLVHCYDLPARNGSSGHILYKPDSSLDESHITLAASERPYFMPAPRIDPTSAEGKRYNMTVVACVKIFGHPPWLQEWLTYQRTLGVDHVHLDTEDTFQQTGMQSQQYFLDMVSEGFLSVDIWKKYLSPNEIWYHNQGLIYEDCPYRFRGTYDYIVMMDTDDFFTPRIPTEKKIHYYIHNFCRGGKIASCKFRWVEYYPDYVGLNNELATDGNVTRRLKDYLHFNQGNPKSLHRTTVLIDTATHYAFKMMPGYQIANVPVNTAYVAHIRLYKKQPDNGYVHGLPNICSQHVLNKLILLTTLMTFILTMCLLVS